jgi:RNA polymerase sigma-70 factor (ECF subfamily)
MAENIGRNARRRDRHLLTAAETEVFFEQAVDETPNSLRTLAARQEVAAVRAVLETMPPRRRKIFVAVWVDDVPQAEVAGRLGLTLRRVQKESQKAREQVRLALRAKREGQTSTSGGDAEND